MPRYILEEANIHPAAQAIIADNQRDIVETVQAAVAANDIVVVGMAQNPVCKKARKLLNQAGLKHEYLEYGSYLKLWRRRNALKMWTGWPTFPMVFHQGQFIGGANQLAKLLAEGAIK